MELTAEMTVEDESTWEWGDQGSCPPFSLWLAGHLPGHPRPHAEWSGQSKKVENRKMAGSGLALYTPKEAS